MSPHVYSPMIPDEIELAIKAMLKDQLFLEVEYPNFSMSPTLDYDEIEQELIKGLHQASFTELHICAHQRLKGGTKQYYGRFQLDEDGDLVSTKLYELEKYFKSPVIKTCAKCGAQCEVYDGGISLLITAHEHEGRECKGSDQFPWELKHKFRRHNTIPELVHVCEFLDDLMQATRRNKPQASSNTFPAFWFNFPKHIEHIVEMGLYLYVIPDDQSGNKWRNAALELHAALIAMGVEVSSFTFQPIEALAARIAADNPFDHMEQ